MSATIYMPEMTNLHVREYLEAGGRRVIVPVGSTEDHGDHGPLWTDVYIPTEVARRAVHDPVGSHELRVTAHNTQFFYRPIANSVTKYSKRINCKSMELRSGFYIF